MFLKKGSHVTFFCFPLFQHRGINYPPGGLLWQSADNQMVQTVRLEACGASYQTKRTQNIFMLSYPLTYSILLSTTSQRLAVRPFSPERETCCMLPICRAFAFLPFIREYSALRRQSPQDFTAPIRRLIFHTPFPVPL